MPITGKPTFTIVTHIVQLLKRDDVQHTYSTSKKSAIQGHQTNEGKEDTRPWNQNNVTSLVVARRPLSFMPMSNLIHMCNYGFESK